MTDQARAAMPLTEDELEPLRLYYRPGFCPEGQMLTDISRLLATIEAVQRQHANAIAFKDRVNKALQDKVENETKLKAERDAAQREAKEARELVENWKGTAAAEAGAFREERNRAEHAEAELSAAREALKAPYQAAADKFHWAFIDVEPGHRWCNACHSTVFSSTNGPQPHRPSCPLEKIAAEIKALESTPPAPEAKEGML